MMTALIATALALVGLFAPLLTPSTARAQDRWNKISTSRIGWAVRQTTFDLTGRDLRAKAVRFAITEGTVRLDAATIHYAGASPVVVRLSPPLTLADGDTSRPFATTDDERVVQKVTLDLGLIGATAGTSTIEMWALQSADAAIVKAPVEAPRRYYRKSARPAAPPVAEESAPPGTDGAPPRSRGLTGEPTGGSGPPSTSAPPPPSPRAPPSAASRAPAPKQPPAARAAPPSDKPYTEIDVFFGTDRKREADRAKFDRAVAAFGTGRARALSLGKAVITVPKQGRDRGSIPRPEWDLVVARFALRAEDLARDFTVLAVDVLDRDRFTSEVRSKLATSRRFRNQAFVFIHGYFVAFDDALFRAAQIAHDLEFDGVPFVYSWPSVAGLSGYILDRGRARDARDHLREFMDNIARDTGASEVHLIAHSMGADPLLEVLRDIARSEPAAAPGQRPRFGEIILAAPDVTRDSFEQIAQQITGIRRGLTLYASANDKAMRASRFTRLGESPAGHVPRSGPVVVPEADTIDVTELDTSFFGVNHTTFAEREPLLGDIQRLIQSGLRPPAARGARFKAVASPTGGYWRFERQP